MREKARIQKERPYLFMQEKKKENTLTNNQLEEIRKKLYGKNN
jgi:hypothetical protein